MSQQEFDFNKDVNEPTFTWEDNLKIDKIVSDFQDLKNKIKNETLIINLFFEEHCIEISKRLKSLGYFDEVWEFETNSFGEAFYYFITKRNSFNNSTLLEFIIYFLGNLNESIKASDFQKNSISNFSFDRKITESILDEIQENNINSAVFIYVVYLKIWNSFKIYIEPFNNNKALLIHRIFSDRIWPKKLITYEVFNEFEKSVQTHINYILNKNIYLPFFDVISRSHYSEKYLQERIKLKENIERLFEYDLTDDSEPYHCLIEDLINNPLENAYKKDIIRSKVNKQMMPKDEDINMFLRLYENQSENELGKLLISKFYLFELLNYDS